MRWKGDENGYRQGICYLGAGFPNAAEPTESLVTTVSDWDLLWAARSGSKEVEFAEPKEGSKYPIRTLADPLPIGPQIDNVGPDGRDD